MVWLFSTYMQWFFKGKRRFWPKGRRRVVINTFGGGESCRPLRSCEPPTRIQLSLRYDLWGMTSEVWPLRYHETASQLTHMTRHYDMRNTQVLKHMLMFFVLSKSAFSFFISFFTVQLLFKCCFVVWKRGTTPNNRMLCIVIINSFFRFVFVFVFFVVVLLYCFNLLCVWIWYYNHSSFFSFCFTFRVFGFCFRTIALFQIFFFSICETVYCMQRGSRPLLAASERRFPSGGVSLAGWLITSRRGRKRWPC